MPLTITNILQFLKHYLILSIWRKFLKFYIKVVLKIPVILLTENFESHGLIAKTFIANVAQFPAQLMADELLLDRGFELMEFFWEVVVLFLDRLVMDPVIGWGVGWLRASALGPVMGVLELK
ncbi:MAG: hypothetical protein Q9224_006894 [Gallowayella concinna]